MMMWNVLDNKKYHDISNTMKTIYDKYLELYLFALERIGILTFKKIESLKNIPK